jgi:putative peptidoglycan lipid II flippase
MVALNISLNFILMQFMAHRGLALSTSITALVNYLLLRVLIDRRLPQVSFAGIGSNLAKSVGICIVAFICGSWMSASLMWYSKIGLVIKSGLIAIFCFGLFISWA